MPQLDTYTQLRQAEDVQDEIFNISPIDNPVVAMSQTVQATGKIHEWTEDILQPARENALVEGADAGDDTSEPVVERQNYCQIMGEVARITNTLEAVRKYGRDSEMAYQLELKYGKLANDLELAVMGNPTDGAGVQQGRQVKTPGDGTTPRKMGSFYDQLDESVIKYCTTDGSSGGTAISTTQELEATLLSAHLATYQAGGDPRYAVTDPLTAGYFASFALSAGRNRDIEQKALINCVDLYVSTYGEVSVVLDRNMTQNDGDALTGDNAIALIDFNYTANGVLRATDDWELARTGDAENRQILREGTFAVLNSKAHALVDAVPIDLTTA